MSEIFNSIQVSHEVSKMVDRSFFIVNQICDILEKQGKTTVDLAEFMGNEMDEVNNWMLGIHDFSEEKILLIQAALGEKINFQLPQ
jgi:transcriptional regulator with XRE-family HTH domain